MNKAEQDLLIEGLNFQNIKLIDSQIDQLLMYLDLLEKWNKVYNLTSIKNKSEMVILHLLDSLSVLREVKRIIEPLNKAVSVIDVGSGGGLPGTPLSICLPDVNFTLIDARMKKVSFLKQVKHTLKLSHVNPIHQRIEAYFPEKKYDIVISRAFASLGDMLGICAHLCHTNGLFLAMKGKKSTAEIEQLSKQYDLKFIKRAEVYKLEAQRHIFGIQKVS